MSRTPGSVLQSLGSICVGGVGTVGVGFCAILLMGFVGTGGREAGGELAAMLALTVLGVGVGLALAWLALVWLGRRLARGAPGAPR